MCICLFVKEARAQEAKALYDLQLERQKWVASLEDMDSLRKEKGCAVETINNNQIDVKSGEYVSSLVGTFNGAVSSTYVWNQLLNQYKEDILQLRNEHSALKNSYSKLVEEKSELIKALRDEQAKSQFRISQV